MKPSRISKAIALSVLVTAFAVWPASAASPLQAIGDQAKIKQTDADMLSFSSALAMYKLNAGTYPSEEQGLKSLVEKPAAKPVPRRWAMITEKIPKDPWGRDYRYAVREKNGTITHVIISDGPDLQNASDNVELVLEAVGKRDPGN